MAERQGRDGGPGGEQMRQRQMCDYVLSSSLHGSAEATLSVGSEAKIKCLLIPLPLVSYVGLCYTEH